MPENKTPEAPEENKEQKEQPKAPETKEQPKAASEKNVESIREEERTKLKEVAKGYKQTPWQKLRQASEKPVKRGALLAAGIALPPVALGALGLDWMAQRIPGVKQMYEAPRRIMFNTANSVADTLIAGATLPVAAPFTVAHEISDRFHGMDTSKPTNLIGHAIDKVGDILALGAKLTKGTIDKTVDIGKAVVPEVGKAAGGVIGAPFKMVGAAYNGVGKIGGITGLVGNVALTTGLAVGGHALIGAGLGAVNPVLAAQYNGYITAIIQSIKGFF